MSTPGSVSSRLTCWWRSMRFIWQKDSSNHGQAKITSCLGRRWAGYNSSKQSVCLVILDVFNKQTSHLGVHLIISIYHNDQNLRSMPLLSKETCFSRALGAYFQVNPEATLPCLRDGSKLLTQSKEIVMYLDERDGMPLGGKQVDRQEVDEWVEMLAQWDGNIVGSGFWFSECTSMH